MSLDRHDAAELRHLVPVKQTHVPKRKMTPNCATACLGGGFRALNPIECDACSVVGRSDAIPCFIESLGWQLGVVKEANGDLRLVFGIMTIW